MLLLHLNPDLHSWIRIRIRMKKQKAGKRMRNNATCLSFLLQELVELEPLAHPVHVQLRASQLLPAVVLVTLLLTAPIEIFYGVQFLQ